MVKTFKEELIREGLKVSGINVNVVPNKVGVLGVYFGGENTYVDKQGKIHSAYIDIDEGKTVFITDTPVNDNLIMATIAPVNPEVLFVNEEYLEHKSVTTVILLANTIISAGELRSRKIETVNA